MSKDTQSQPQPTSAPPKRLETRDPKQLKSHPLQNVVIVDLKGPDRDRLKSDLDKNGQSYEIEITADDVIIDGHQRNRIALELGWPAVKVWVRDDLVNQAAIEDRFLTANLNRRHMTPLEKARCYKYLIEQAAKAGQRRRKTDGVRGDRRDELGKILGCSGRTLDRWLRVLETPVEVQQAVEAKKLTLQEAERVADLADVLQEKVAAQIREGHDPKRVIASYTLAKARQDRTGKSASRALKNFLSTANYLEQLKAEAKECLTTYDRARLQRVQATVTELIQHIDEDPDSCGTIAEDLQDLEKVAPNQVRKPRPATVQKGDQRPAKRSKLVTK